MAFSFLRFKLCKYFIRLFCMIVTMCYDDIEMYAILPTACNLIFEISIMFLAGKPVL